MRGVPEWNFPAFAEVSAWLRSCGHEVVSPAEHDLEVDPACVFLPEYLTGGEVSPEVFHRLIGWDLKVIADPDPDVRIDALVLLPGWESSVGVQHEIYVARATGKPVYRLHYDESGPCEVVRVPA